MNKTAHKFLALANILSIFLDVSQSLDDTNVDRFTVRSFFHNAHARQ
jgi:hypothetical protein